MLDLGEKVMIDLELILDWLRYRRQARDRKRVESMLLELNALTVTIHGRQLLTAVCKDEDNDLPDEIRRIYWVLLQTAPVEIWAEWN